MLPNKKSAGAGKADRWGGSEGFGATGVAQDQALRGAAAAAKSAQATEDKAKQKVWFFLSSEAFFSWLLCAELIGHYKHKGCIFLFLGC